MVHSQMMNNHNVKLVSMPAYHVMDLNQLNAKPVRVIYFYPDPLVFQNALRDNTRLEINAKTV